MRDEEVLAEVENLLRTIPAESEFARQENSEENDEWLGRAVAVLAAWSPIDSIGVGLQIAALQSGRTNDAANADLLPDVMRDYNVISEQLARSRHGPAYRAIRTLLFRAQHDLQMKTVGPLSTVVDAEKPYAYFEEVRQLIQLAREDLLFIDPYLDAEFVSRYLPQINDGVGVRLLTSNSRMSSLLPAIDVFLLESSLKVQVRVPSCGLHDRFLLVDMTRCYQSGASFKDGAKRSLTTLTQITDNFSAMHRSYEEMWNVAETKFPRSVTAA